MVTTSPRIITGAPCEKWEEVQAIQHEPFIYISSCGSHWAGDEPDDVTALLKMLAEHPLDPTFEKYGNFIEANPCEGVYNPNYLKRGKPQWQERYIDGPRLYTCEGVYHFSGNFFDWSFAFGIDTNDADTIERLTTAIRANQQRADYKAAKKMRARKAGAR